MVPLSRGIFDASLMPGLFKLHVRGEILMKNLAAAFSILLSFPFVSGPSMASETVSCSDLVDQLIKGAQDSSY